jgi:hypothetical protein
MTILVTRIDTAVKKTGHEKCDSVKPPCSKPSAQRRRGGTMTDEIKADQESTRPADSPGKVARPTEYTSEIGETICGGLAEDESLQSICATPGMPDVTTVARWISNNPEFRERYAFARQFQAHCIAREVIELVDAASTQWVEKVRANGRVVRGPNRKNLPRCRLRIEVRKWVVDQLLARAHELSARRIFELPIGPESKILQGLSLDFSNMMKGSQHD